MAVALLSACATTRGAPERRANLDEEIRVSQGEWVRVGADELDLRFVRVTEDSRCPINARCIRAGSAKIEVEMGAPGARTTRAILVTPDEPKGATYGAFDIAALELQPGREIGKPAPRFEAVLRVHRR